MRGYRLWQTDDGWVTFWQAICRELRYSDPKEPLVCVSEHSEGRVREVVCRLSITLKADYLEYAEAEREAPAPLPRSSEQRLPRRIPVPWPVRWREFRIEFLPLLAVAGALLLAGFVWQKAVRPVPVEVLDDPPPALAKEADPDPALANPAMPHVSHAGTNGFGKGHVARE